nr:uncharacterized protein LOC123772453 [Procambarus clarkii]
MEDKILRDIVQLLQDVQWLYNFPVTQVFTRNVFSKMPDEWKEALSELPLEVLNGIPQFKSQVHWPSSLKSFLESCERLSLQHLAVHHHRQSMAILGSQNVQLPQKFTHGMSVKKKHEVTSLLSLMKRLSEITQSVHVLDIGSGIGYMDTLLHCMLKLTIIGAESDNKNVRSANKRQRELLGKCRGVRHMTWTLADDTLTIRKAKEVLLELIHRNDMCTCQLKRQCITPGNMSKNPSVVVGNECETNASADSGDQAETAEGSVHAETGKGHKETAEGDSQAEIAKGDDHAETAKGDTNAEIAKDDDHSETAEGDSRAETVEGDSHAETAEGDSHAETAEVDDHVEALAHALDGYPPKSAILFGLHACADLSPIMIKIFKDCPEASSLVLLSCCYHKMQLFKKDKMMQLPKKNKMQLLKKNKRQLLKGNKKQLLKEDKKELLNENTAKQSDDINSPRNYNTEMSCSNASGNYEDSDESRNVKQQFKQLGFEETENKFTDDNGEDFINFPMSTALKNILRENEFQMSVFGLRLAAQESGLRWIHQTEENHENHKRNVVYRALLEAFCIREGFTLRKLRRRCVRKYQFIDFSDYIKNVTMNYEFLPSKDNVHIARSNKSKNCSKDDILVIQGKENSHKAVMGENLPETTEPSPCQSHETLETPTITQDYIKCALEQCYEDYHHLFPLIEPLTGLQLALQSVLEALVHVDRLVYLKESGFANVWMEEVFDAEMSPRNIALVAVR